MSGQMLIEKQSKIQNILVVKEIPQRASMHALHVRDPGLISGTRPLTHPEHHYKKESPYAVLFMTPPPKKLKQNKNQQQQQPVHS